jgi:hypothetical protein
MWNQRDEVEGSEDILYIYACKSWGHEKRTTSRKTRLPHNLIFLTTTSRLNNKSTINYIVSILKMEDPLWSSPPRDGEHGNWHTPPRKTVRILARQGKSDHEIVAKTGIPKTTVLHIRRQESSRRPHKSKGFHQRIMTMRKIRRAIRFISKDYTSHYMSYKQVCAILGIKASTHTIRRELRQAGYQRCITCPRPFISRV